MTEKLLLYGGALQQAGAVRMKGEQRATQSDFMEMEKARGISISSTVMTFDYNKLRINILDTPGHQGEVTHRFTILFTLCFLQFHQIIYVIANLLIMRRF